MRPLDPKYSDPLRQMETYWWMVEQTSRLAIQTGVARMNASVRHADIARCLDNFVFHLVQVSNLFLEPTLLVDIALRAGNDMAKGDPVVLSLRPKRSGRAALAAADFVERIISENPRNASLASLARDRRLMAITLLWTGFEATLKDAWHAAVSKQPAKAYAAAVSMRPKRHARKPLRTGATSADIADWGNFRFSAARSLFESYSMLLGPAAPVLNSLEGWLGAYLTEKVRHVVVHNGGRVDQDFIDDAGGGFGLAVGAPIDVPNETLYAMMQNVCDLGLKACLEIDAWI